MAELTKRKDEILERTLEIVRDSGLAGVTTRRIAERVGFSEPALYRYFPNKQAILLALMGLLEEKLVEPAVRIASDYDRPVMDRLEAIMAHHAALVRRENSLPILLLAAAAAGDDTAMIDRMRGILERYLGAIEAVVREGQAGGVLTSAVQADSLALLLLGAPAALAIRRRLSPDEDADRRYQETLLPFLVRQIAGTNDPGSRRLS